MVEKIRMFLDAFGKITTGVIIAATIFITVFGGKNCEISIHILWQVLAVSAFCSLGILMFPSHSEKELSKRGMLIRKTVYFIYVNILVLGAGGQFGWFSFQSWKMVLFMELLIIGVYIFVNLITYMNDYAIARSMNEKLSEKRR